MSTSRQTGPVILPETGDRSLGDDIGYIVGVAIIVIVLFQSGTSAAAAKLIENGSFKAQLPEYLQFAHLFCSTLFLSLSIALAIALYAVPRIYGYSTHWGVAPWVVFGGAALTAIALGMPQDQKNDQGVGTGPGIGTKPAAYIRLLMLHEHNGRSAVFIALFTILLLGLAIFAQIYGAAFIAGAIVGVAGGLIISSIVDHHRDGATGTREPLPWREGAAGVIAAIAAAAFLIVVLTPALASQVTQP